MRLLGFTNLKVAFWKFTHALNIKPWKDQESSSNPTFFKFKNYYFILNEMEYSTVWSFSRISCDVTGTFKINLSMFYENIYFYR